MLRRTLLTLALLATPSIAAAQNLCVVEQAKVVPADSAPGDQLGSAVAVDGTLCVIGAPERDDNGGSSGAAYVYRRVGNVWTEEDKLFGTQAGDRFGYSVAVSGDVVVVGAIKAKGVQAGTGAAYVFERQGTGWIQTAKLAPNDSSSGDNFGQTVAVSGDWIAVGAPFDDDTGSNSGGVYVFTRNGTSWTQNIRLSPFGLNQGDEFGSALAIENETIVAGSYLRDENGIDSGVAYVFQRFGLNWIEQAKLVPADGAASDQFGISVDVDGDTALVGAYLDSDLGMFSGSAYVFERVGTTWTEDDKLTASDGATSHIFGTSVAIDGDRALIGAPQTLTGIGKGAAYVFERGVSGWTELDKVEASDAAPADEFGFAVDLSGELNIIGSRMDDDGGSSSGSAYLVLATDGAIPYCSSGASSNGCTPTLSGVGTPSATAPNGFTLQALGVQAQADGFLFYGMNGRLALPWGASFLCVRSPLQRMGLSQTGGTAGGCNGFVSKDWNQYARTTTSALGNPFGAGQTVWAQLWYVDAGSPGGSNLTNAVEFTLCP